jgi:hypothetical protein
MAEVAIPGNFFADIFQLVAGVGTVVEYVEIL